MAEVNGVRGALDTPIFRLAESQGIVSSEAFSAKTLLKRMGKPEEVADVLMFLLSDKAAYVTGGSNPHILGFEID
jgi:NAD(P)-dependent dehydrogenase (short-subunit alcohol dehydrogenase family)